MKSSSIRSLRKGAFTLIELLVVIAIIALMLTMTALAFRSSMQSQTLSAAAKQLSSDLEYGLLLARKENRPVNVLFYKFEPADQPPGSVSAIRAYQIGVLTGFDANNKPIYRFLTEARRFNNGIVLLPNVAYTTLLSVPEQPALTKGGVPETHTWITYQIRPDGTTTLETNEKHVLTLLWEQNVGNGSTLPPDYRSVVINPVNGRTRVY